MGYYVQIEDHDEVTLYLENEEEAFRRFIEMSSKYDHLKNGGRSGPGIDRNAPENRWFSWMNDYETKCKNAGDVLEYLGFEIVRNDNGCVIDGYDSKIGQEELFINEVADLMSPGYIIWLGEDGNRWKWVFDGKTMKTQNAEIVWKD